VIGGNYKSKTSVKKEMTTEMERVQEKIKKLTSEIKLTRRKLKKDEKSLMSEQSNLSLLRKGISKARLIHENDRIKGMFCFELREMGVHHQDIALKLGISGSRAVHLAGQYRDKYIKPNWEQG